MRVNLFRHKHEIESGRTSSVGMEIMGFDAKGEVVVSSVPGRKLTWEEIGKRSAKVISFTDLAGHERYLRTTVFGLLSSEPNYCLRKCTKGKMCGVFADKARSHGCSQQWTHWHEQVRTTLCKSIRRLNIETDFDSQRASWDSTGSQCSGHGCHNQNRHMPSSDSSTDHHSTHQDFEVSWRAKDSHIHPESERLHQYRCTFALLRMPEKIFRVDLV